MRSPSLHARPGHVFGWKRDTPDPRDQKYAAPFWKKLFLPAKADLRSFCSRVEQQGDIGSCTANASTSAVEFLYKKSGRPQPELSRLFLYYATRVWVADEAPTTDDGAMIRNVVKALAKYGVCYESTWAYASPRYALEPSPAAKAEAEQHQILGYYRCPSLRYIKACLAEGYPCVGGFSVPESIDSEKTTKTGVLTYPPPQENFVGGHAVLFVGYDDKTQLLTFQNSWGTWWGDKGYGYLPYAFVTDGLAADFWTIRTAENVGPLDTSMRPRTSITQ